MNFVDLHKAPFLLPPTCDGRRVQSRERGEVGESVMGDLMRGELDFTGGQDENANVITVLV